jgi:hypothetical protein
MNMRNIYLLVPVKGQNGFKAGMAIDKIRMHIGRGAKLDAAHITFERELNGGKTWKEILEDCKTPEQFADHKANAWQVYDDTWSQWNSFIGSQDWPVQKEVDAYIEAHAYHIATDATAKHSIGERLTSALDALDAIRKA